MTRHAREASLSGASHYDDIDFDDDDDKKTVGSASTARNSATHVPYRDSEVPPVPSLPWKRGSDESDPEKQESEQKPGNGEEEKDPNLIEWNGPDDPVCDSKRCLL